MSAPQNQFRKKDFSAQVTGVADKTVTNASTAKDAVLPLGSRVPAGGTAIVTNFEWLQVPTADRTAFQLTAV